MRILFRARKSKGKYGETQGSRWHFENQGLSNATLPFVLALANKGWQQACRDDKHLLEGLNIHDGHVTYEAVARDLNLAYKPAAETL